MDITGIGSIFDFGGKVIDKLFPDKDAADKAKLEMFKLQQEGAFKELEGQIRLAEGQMKVNEAEANKGGLLNQWRPALGWVCVLAYGYNFVAMPALIWFVKLYGGSAPVMVALDTTELGVLLAGMLGIGGMRSFDKTKGTSK